MNIEKLPLIYLLKKRNCLFSGGNVDLVEQTDSMSEIGQDDASSDTSMSEDDVPYYYKDDTNADPDWDPDCPSDFPNKPATRKNPVETAGCDDDDLRITDDSSHSDGDAEDDMKVDEFSSVKCQSCDFCCRTQAPLTNHVMQEHYDEASRNEKHICMDCGQVEDTMEALQHHKEVGLFSLSLSLPLSPSLSLTPSPLLSHPVFLGAVSNSDVGDHGSQHSSVSSSFHDLTDIGTCCLYSWSYSASRTLNIFSSHGFFSGSYFLRACPRKSSRRIGFFRYAIKPFEMYLNTSTLDA